jgi:hypothetical protein
MTHRLPPEGTTAEYLIRAAGIIEDENNYSYPVDEDRLPLELDDVLETPDGILLLLVAEKGRKPDDPELTALAERAVSELSDLYPGQKFSYSIRPGT